MVAKYYFYIGIVCAIKSLLRKRIARLYLDFCCIFLLSMRKHYTSRTSIINPSICSNSGRLNALSSKPEVRHTEGCSCRQVACVGSLTERRSRMPDDRSPEDRSPEGGHR